MDKHTSNNGAVEGFKITGNWDKQTNILKEKFPSLTDSDLKYENGKEKELVTRVGARLNKKDEEVVNILKKNLEVKS